LSEAHDHGFLNEFANVDGGKWLLVNKYPIPGQSEKHSQYKVLYNKMVKIYFLFHVKTAPGGRTYLWSPYREVFPSVFYR